MYETFLLIINCFKGQIKYDQPTSKMLTKNKVERKRYIAAKIREVQQRNTDQIARNRQTVSSTRNRKQHKRRVSKVGKLSLKRSLNLSNIDEWRDDFPSLDFDEPAKVSKKNRMHKAEQMRLRLHVHRALWIVLSCVHPSYCYTELFTEIETILNSRPLNGFEYIKGAAAEILDEEDKKLCAILLQNEKESFRMLPQSLALSKRHTCCFE